MIQVTIKPDVLKKKEKKDVQYCFRAEGEVMKKLQKHGVDIPEAIREFLRTLALQLSD